MNEIILKKSESDAGKQYGMNNEWIQIYIEKSIWVKKIYQNNVSLSGEQNR